MEKQLSADQVKENEARCKVLAKVTNRFSDLAINCESDSPSYLQKPINKFFYPTQIISPKKNKKKWEKYKIPIVLHSCTNPFIKGTEIVRQAAARLKKENHKFEYIDAVRCPHQELMEFLDQAHIVLVQFYCVAPGLLTVEALHRRCAVMTSASCKYNSALPRGADKAWFVTNKNQVYDHLKKLLLKPRLAKQYAYQGYHFATKHFSYKYAEKEIHSLLKTL